MEKKCCSKLSLPFFAFNYGDTRKKSANFLTFFSFERIKKAFAIRYFNEFIHSVHLCTVVHEANELLFDNLIVATISGEHIKIISIIMPFVSIFKSISSMKPILFQKKTDKTQPWKWMEQLNGIFTKQ